MSAASQRGCVEACLAQHAGNDFHMRRFAAMRGASQCKLFITERVTIGSAGFYQRQRLQRLDRRTREYRLCHVADGKHRRPIGVDDSHRAAMAALNQAAAAQLDEDRIAHCSVGKSRCALLKISHHRLGLIGRPNQLRLLARFGEEAGGVIGP